MLNHVDNLVDQVIARAVEEISDKGFSGQIVTFALYFDHEGEALSVCADTLENSLTVQKGARAFSYEYLSKAIKKGDLEDAALFNHNVGRSLSLGDFTLRGLGEYVLESGNEAPEMPESFFVSLAQGLHRNTGICLSVCDPNQPVVLTCSTATDEAGLVWSPPMAGD